MFVSLERKKYEEFLKCVQNQCYSNCRKAKLVYLAPAAMREPRQRLSTAAWLKSLRRQREAIGRPSMRENLRRAQIAAEAQRKRRGGAPAVPSRFHLL